MVQASDPMADPASGAAVDPATDPASDATAGPASDAVADPSSDPAADPASDAAADRMADPATHPAAEAAADPTRDPATAAAEAPRLAIPFHSGAGHTRALVAAAAEGARAAGARCETMDVETLDAAGWASLDAADAILFAAPTWMGSASGPFKTFMDDSSDRWSRQDWADRLAAGMTVATFPSGDKLSTLTQFAVFAAQHGMIWVGQAEIGAPVTAREDGVNAQGAWLGLAATSDRDKTRLISEGDAESARRLGARLARAAARWRAGASGLAAHGPTPASASIPAPADAATSSPAGAASPSPAGAVPPAPGGALAPGPASE